MMGASLFEYMLTGCFLELRKCQKRFHFLLEKVDQRTGEKSRDDCSDTDLGTQDEADRDTTEVRHDPDFPVS